MPLFLNMAASCVLLLKQTCCGMYSADIGRNVQLEIQHTTVEATVIYGVFISGKNTLYLDCITFAPGLCVHPL